MKKTILILIAFIIAVSFATLSFFGVIWSFLGIFVYYINFPGILLCMPNLPPEGLPWQNPLKAFVMIVVQGSIWFCVLLLLKTIVFQKNNNKSMTREKGQ